MPWSYHLHSTISATTQKSKMVAILLKTGVLRHKTYSWGDLLQCYLQNDQSDWKWQYAELYANYTLIEQVNSYYSNVNGYKYNFFLSRVYE